MDALQDFVNHKILAKSHGPAPRLQDQPVKKKLTLITTNTEHITAKNTSVLMPESETTSASKVTYHGEAERQGARWEKVTFWQFKGQNGYKINKDLQFNSNVMYFCRLGR